MSAFGGATVKHFKFYTDLTLQTKLLLAIGLLVLFTGLVFIIVADYGLRKSTNAQAAALFSEVSANAVGQTKDFVLRAAPIAQTLQQLANHDLGLRIDDLDALAPQLLAFLQGNHNLTFVLYGDEKTGGYAAARRMDDDSLHIQRSYIANGKTYFTESKVVEGGAWVLAKKTDDEGYDPRARPFYKLAKETGKLAYTPPYMFFSQRVPGVSCVIPAKDDQGNLRGVFSVEFDLNALSRFVAQLSLGKKSDVFLFMPDRTLLAHRNLQKMVNKGVRGKDEMLSLKDTGDEVVQGFQEHLKEEYLVSGFRSVNADAGVKTDIDTGDSKIVPGDRFHFFEFTHHDVSYMASTTVFPVSPGQWWVLGAIAPKADVNVRLWRTRGLDFLATTVALCVASVIAVLIARYISNPIQQMTTFLQHVSQGDLEAKANFHGAREFNQLSNTLNVMIPELRERLELRHSLQLAMAVQKSLLPERDPVTPLLDIAGRLKYCDETGGDYYDFISLSMLPPTSIIVAVGDVMGHGIPSALVMATARAALRTCALHDHHLGNLISRTNNVLTADNRHDRFMTLSLLLIDAETRIVRWVSGGHDPAIVYDPGSDSFIELKGGDMMLGIMENIDYKEYVSESMAVNSVLVTGTDGLWEMFNEKAEMYGKQRLQNVIQKHHKASAFNIGAALEADLKVFRGAKVPIDDVTFVVVKFLSLDNAMV